MYSGATGYKWRSLIVLICVISMILTRGGDVIKQRSTDCDVDVAINDKHVNETLLAENRGKNESIFFDTRKMWSCFLPNILKDMKCKKYNCVLWVWRRMNSLLLVSFRNVMFNTTSLNAQKIVSSTHDRRLSFCVFSEISGKSRFLIDLKPLDVVVRWIQKWSDIVTLICMFMYFRTTRTLKKYKEKHSKLIRTKFLIGLTHRGIQSNITAYPSSFDQYFKDVTKRTKENLMNYEWARYATYESFPETSVASPMRLAKAGFYYKGQEEEGICFSCGLKNKHWHEHETVLETHKRLSPGCHFVNGTDRTNVPIHASELGNSASVTSPNSDGACGGPSDASNDTAESTMPRASNSEDKYGNEKKKLKPPIVVPGILNYQNGNIQRFPGIHRETPKFPDFAVKCRRLLTFSDWPDSNPVSSASLAESGFYFTGPQDAVRCFFCGAGMNNWQYGDNPWIEHARWFPNCAYVRQFKGEDFVNMCRAANIDTELYNQISQTGNETSQTNAISDRQIEDLNSAAAKTVLEMGYTQDQVEEAIRQHRQTQDVTEIRIQHLLEYLLDNTYTPSQAEATSNKRTKTDQRPPDNASPQKCKTSPTTADKDAKALAEENETLKEKMMCKICFDKDANVVFIPCGHMVSCIECAHALRKCAVCRKLIEGRIRTYLA